MWRQQNGNQKIIKTLKIEQMKEIKAFIRPENLKMLAENLKKENFCCFTVFEGEGVGDFTDPKTKFPSLKFPFLHNKMVKIELVSDDEDVSKIVNIIKNHAHTGKKGDGLIYVSNIDYKVKIRTGERNNNMHSHKE